MYSPLYSLNIPRLCMIAIGPNWNNLHGMITAGAFRCTVDSVGGGYVTAYGPGLNMASSGKETEFSVVGGRICLISIPCQSSMCDVRFERCTQSCSSSNYSAALD